MSTHVDVDSKDVVRIILQYLKENNLPSAFSALQSESGITMNTVDNIEVFSSDIKYGRWDSVISHLQNISIPREKLCALYEQIVLELIESREVDLARDILRSTEIMRYLKEENCERYMKLEYLAKLSSFNASDAYESGTSKERKRLELAESISSEISTVPPSRLLSLLGQAMKYQSAAGTLPPGSQFDLFRGDRKAASRDFEEKVPKKLAGSIKFAKESHPETVIFSPEGSSLVTGSVDGFIEVLY